jgi:hypothetical protein
LCCCYHCVCAKHREAIRATAVYDALLQVIIIYPVAFE